MKQSVSELKKNWVEGVKFVRGRKLEVSNEKSHLDPSFVPYEELFVDIGIIELILKDYEL